MLEITPNQTHLFLLHEVPLRLNKGIKVKIKRRKSTLQERWTKILNQLIYLRLYLQVRSPQIRKSILKLQVQKVSLLKKN